jgi:hypothetical protein
MPCGVVLLGFTFGSTFPCAGGADFGKGGGGGSQRMDIEGPKISALPQSKDGPPVDDNQAAIIAAVARRRRMLEEKGEKSVVDVIEFATGLSEEVVLMFDSTFLISVFGIFSSFPLTVLTDLVGTLSIVAIFEIGFTSTFGGSCC